MVVFACLLHWNWTKETEETENMCVFPPQHQTNGGIHTQRSKNKKAAETEQKITLYKPQIHTHAKRSKYTKKLSEGEMHGIGKKSHTHTQTRRRKQTNRKTNEEGEKNQ